MSDPSTRTERLAALAEHSYDLLVVGGGITGCGVARDAALRGLSVALIDKDDYASGTSSKSSKLVHGGLRYLESFQFGLVFESLRERAIQRRLNPHLVWPVPFCFPVYDDDRTPLWKINIGLWLYDALSLFRSHKLHRRLSVDRTASVLPGIRREGMSGSVHYYDCGTDDARLTLANALGAERAGATVLNYVRFERPEYAPQGDRLEGALVTDELTATTVSMRCRHIIYCGGPWTDQLEGAAGKGRLLRRTKGVHLVVSRERFPIPEVVAAVRTEDFRPCFAVPFDDCVYIGTTDTDYEGDLDVLAPTREDVAYLLDTINRYFPGAELTADDVRSTWSGLRPLVADDAVADASDTSREHVLTTDAIRGITTIAGGKLTTYRSMAQAVVDDALKVLATNSEATRPGRCLTHKVPIDDALPDEGTLTDALQRMLWRHHGSGMNWIMSRMASHPAERERVDEHLTYVMAQVSYAVLAEHAERVADVLIRRLQVFYRSPDQGLSASHQVAKHMASLTNRPQSWIDAEIAHYAHCVAISRRGLDRGKPVATDAPVRGE